MGDLTKNLSRWEFSCECGCGQDAADYELVNAVQGSCDHFNKRGGTHKIHVTGPNRCRRHNATVKGAAANSDHIYSKALDYYITQLAPSKLYDYLDKKYPDKHCIILYHNRVHFSIRATAYREIK